MSRSILSTNHSKTRSHRLRPRPPRLRFRPTAWAKLLFLRDAGPTEVGGFGISAPDDLLLVECLPAQETRAYVQKVVAGYWTYRRMWGRPAATLDAAATGAVADPRLDLAQPDGAPAELAAQTLQVGMR